MRTHLALVLAFAGCTGEPPVHVLTAAATSALPTTPGWYSLEYDVSNGDPRGYGLYLPTGYTTTGAALPMLAVFHGGGSSVNAFAVSPGMLRLKQIVDSDPHVVVFLQGSYGTDLSKPGEWDVTGLIRNDLLYTRELLDALKSGLNVDDTRVFAAGHSEGGRFVHALGQYDSTYFRGIAAVESSYAISCLDLPAPAPAVRLPVFMVHQDHDPVITFDGSYTDTSPYDYVPGVESYDFWYTRNTCTDLTADILSPLYHGAVTSCAGSSANQLAFITVFNNQPSTVNDNHKWPTQSGEGYDASQAMIDFFDAL